MHYILELIKSNFTVILTSMLPLIELRGAIPVGIALGMSPAQATILSILGSTVPVPFILLFIRPLFKFLRKFKWTGKIIDKITAGAMNKSKNVIKYEFWGLAMFVGIPLPGTGAWTGALIASLLDMPIRIALPSIFIGNIMAGTIIYLLSYTALGVIKLF